MTIRRFNITNFIKVSMIIIFALMLNIGLADFALAQETQQEKVEVTEVVNAGKCSAAVYRAQHSAGCWSCLVIERLTSAFLQVAKNGLPVTQKAGVALLVLGSVLWILMWGLKNVSSFSEIQLANILNELFKFMFKAMLAYWFIVLSSTAISQYFVRPIMSVGAIIGQNMWGEELQDQTVPWDDLADVDITQEVQKAESKKAKEIKKAKKDSSRIEQDQDALAELNARMEKDKASKSEIPPFQMPGCNGSITSFPGCRVPPPTNNQTNCGSFSHMGIDIGAQNGTPIWAIAGGDAVYSQSKSWGNMVKITTKHKGATWTHLYAHMNQADWEKYKAYHASKGYKVARGEIIGGVGNTGQSGGNHLHLELIVSGTVGGKSYSNAVVEPISLAEGKIVVRGKKSGSATGAVDRAGCTCGTNGNPGCNYHRSWNPISKASSAEKKRNKSCKGFNSKDPGTRLKKGSKIPTGGVTNPGVTPETITSAYTGGFIPTGIGFHDSPSIPQINYTGPTNIVPKSIMESLLGALRVITNTTADNMVLGQMVMCYANLENGGKWDLGIFKMVNIIKWLQGLIIYMAGLLLTLSIAYYFLDISFKLGFSVLAMPIAAGLWPFKKTEDKIKAVLSIMIKASASFAFMALITSYGMALVSEALNDLDVLYEKIEKISIASSDAELDELNEYIDETLAIFSSTFLLMCFAMYYFYKLVSEGVEKFVNKFFPDAVFGDANPMHETATKATSKAFNGVMKVTGAKFAADVVKHQTSQAIKGVGQRAGSKVGKGVSNVAKKMIGKK